MGKTCFLLHLMAAMLSCIFVATVSVEYHSSNITTDELALLALKEHVTRDPHNVLATNWSSATPVCYWIGVTCSLTSNNQRVTALNLSHMGLTGTIPPQLGNLSFLAELDIEKNIFHGSIPKELANLSRLNYINFRYNSFGGEIPSWFGSFSRLQSLLLCYNNFTGSIPSSIFNISSLQVFKLGYNKLSFHLSSDTFDQLPKLQGIAFSGNQVCGRIPTSLFKCKHLKEMFFGDSQLEGSVPIEIGNLTSLQYMDLHNNNLEGVIPANIKSLTSLTWLDLSSNGFTGPIPTDLPPSLLWFSVSENQLVGEMAPSICNLSSLLDIDLSLNNFGGTIPECLGNLSSSLLHVSLHKNNFHGEIAGILFPKNCSLRSFYIHNNQLEGPIPQSLVNCKDLNVLNVGKNNLNDTFPWWLGNLKNLQVLILRSNRLRGQIVESHLSKSSFSQLRIIVLSDNDFNGCLPSKLFENLHAIISIRDDEEKGEAKYMEHNYTSGYWWDEFLSLTTKGLDMEFTKILTTLTAIDFSNNQFIGELPGILGKLQSLRVLNISHNNLTGPIPSSLSNLSKLESLDLSSNKLQGRIPAQLKNLTSLEVVNFSWNNLTGLIPQGNQFGTFGNDSYLGNSGLCGLPLSKSCIQDGSLKPHREFDDTKRELNWKISMLMGYGCGLVFGFSMGYIMFTTGKPWRFIRMIERLQQKFVGRI